MLVDTRLTDEQEASCRVFRIYVDVPAHYHTSCDEYLLVVSGRGMFRIADGEWFEAREGQLIFFKKSTVHAITLLDKEPLVFLAVDTHRVETDPADVGELELTHGQHRHGFVRAIADEHRAVRQLHDRTHGVEAGGLDGPPDLAEARHVERAVLLAEGDRERAVAFAR